MRHQLDLLNRTDWDLLIVLDACRVDSFRERCSAEAEQVRSPGVCTKSWVHAVEPMLAERGALWVSGNPIVERELARLDSALPTSSVWDHHWGRFTEHYVPSVHPMSVATVAIGELMRGTVPLVAHILQPHSPYIGAVPLAMARWGSGDPEMVDACHGLPRPDRAVAADRLSWGDVREAYLANLDLAWEAARHLAEVATGEGRTVVVTSDHGECLGEEIGGRERFGHECHWRHPVLWTVPWLALRASNELSRTSDVEGAKWTGESEQATTREKLEALGYFT